MQGTGGALAVKEEGDTAVLEDKTEPTPVPPGRKAVVTLCSLMAAAKPCLRHFTRVTANPDNSPGLQDPPHSGTGDMDM